MTIRSSRAAVAAALSMSVAIALACTTLARAAEPSQITITKFAFEPKEITVAPGTNVVWTNKDETPHTVASNDKSFASKGLDTGDTYEHTFDREGDFAYICTVHPFMTGVVHVRK